MLAIGACSAPPSRFPDTALFADLGGLDFETGRARLRQRVEARYAVGEAEAGLADYLRGQGLGVRRLTTSGAPGMPIYGESSARQGLGVCDRVVHVNWRADAAGILRELTVVYGDTGCL